MTDPRILVVHVVYRFDVGGLENGIVNLINRLPADRFRHAVVALTTCAPSFCARITRPDVEFISLEKSPGHGVKLYPRLFRLFRSLRPTIVHTRNLAALEAVVPAMVAGVPARVHGEHGWEESDPLGTNAKFRILRKIYRPFVSSYVALSGHLERYLQSKVGVPPQRVLRICNGVDTSRFTPAESRRPLVGSPFNAPELVVVGAVGRLQAVKDQINLVRAFALACKQGGAGATNLRLVLVGDGPLRAAVESEVSVAGIEDRVWLAGERADVPDVMRSFDIFVLPSISEGISNTILEAMASGLPVIATDVGGNAELVVANQTGVLVPAQDPVSLSFALAEYAESAATCRAHGLAGRARVEEVFSLDGMVARYAALYERLVTTKQPSRAYSVP